MKKLLFLFVVLLSLKASGQPFKIGASQILFGQGLTISASGDSLINLNTGGGSSVWGGITGTLSNQTDLQNALNTKINISDTATMLINYAELSELPNISGKLNISDTLAMLSNYLAALNLRVKYSDTASMLSNYLQIGVANSSFYPLNTNPAGYITSTGITPAALTKVDDTNVTLTLGGTPATSLLQAVSLTLGWTGTLADGRIASAATWNAKQDALVSGTNIKTINGNSLLGSGDLSIGGITIGTTTITGGTNTRILYNNSGVVGEYTTTGTGTIVPLSISPALTGSPTAPTQAKGTNNTTIATTEFFWQNNKAPYYSNYATGPTPAVRWHTGARNGFVPGGNSLAIVQHRLSFMPMPIGRTYVIDSIAVHVLTAGSAGTTAHIGFYKQTSCYPDSLSFDATVSVASTGRKSAFVNVTVTAGFYWFVLSTDATTLLIPGIPSDLIDHCLGRSAPDNSGQQMYLLIHAGVYAYGALPAAIPASNFELAATTLSPMIGIYFHAQ